MEKFRNYVGLVLCLCIVTTVSTAQRKVETVAEKVMLFIAGAQVTRTKRVDIPAGNSALLFTGLSPYLDARSMQVSAKGKLTITNVNLQYNFLDSLAVGRKQEQLQQTLKKIEKQQEVLGQRIRATYKSGGQANYLTALLDSNGIGDFLSRVQAISKVMGMDKQVIDELTSEKEKLDSEVKELEDKTTEVNKLNSEIQSKIDE